MNLFFSLDRIKKYFFQIAEKNSIVIKSGIFLAAISGGLVFILFLLNYFTAEIQLLQKESFEEQARKVIFHDAIFSKPHIYIVKSALNNAKSKQKLWTYLKQLQQSSSNFNEKSKGSLFFDDNSDLSKQKKILLSKNEWKYVQTTLENNRIPFITYWHVYEPFKKSLLGYLLRSTIHNGYSGDIVLLFGLDTQLKIVDFRMIAHNETPGLGAKANNSMFRNAFKLKIPSTLPQSKKLFQPILSIDTISGATVTSLAISKGIRQVFENFSPILDRLNKNILIIKTSPKPSASPKSPTPSKRKSTSISNDKKINEKKKSTKPKKIKKKPIDPIKDYDEWFFRDLIYE